MVAVDGIVDGAAPAVGAEGFDVFVLGEADGLEERLRQVGDGAGGFGLDVAANDGGEDAGQGGREIAGGEVVAGEEVGQVLADGFGSAGAGFFLGVVEAEVGMVADAGSAATAAIGESEQTQRCAVFLIELGHKVSLEFEILDCLERTTDAAPIGRFIPQNPRDGKELAFPALLRVNRGYKDGLKTETPRQSRGVVVNRDIVP